MSTVDDSPKITLIDHDKIYNFLKSQGLYNDVHSYHQTDTIVFIDISSYDLDNEEGRQSFQYALIGLIYKLCIVTDLIGRKKRLKLFPFGVACAAPIIIDASNLAKTPVINQLMVKKIKTIIDDIFLDNESINHGNFFSLPFEEMAEEFHKNSDLRSAQLMWWQLFQQFFIKKQSKPISIFGRIFDRNNIKKAQPANVYIVTSSQQNQGAIAEHPSQLQKILCKMSHLPAHFTLIGIDNSPKIKEKKQPASHFLTQIKRFLLKSLTRNRRFTNLAVIEVGKNPEQTLTLQQLIEHYPKAMLQAMEHNVICRDACTLNWGTIATARISEKIPQTTVIKLTKACHPERRAREIQELVPHVVPWKSSVYSSPVALMERSAIKDHTLMQGSKH